MIAITNLHSLPLSDQHTKVECHHMQKQKMSFYCCLHSVQKSNKQINILKHNYAVSLSKATAVRGLQAPQDLQLNPLIQLIQLQALTKPNTLYNAIMRRFLTIMKIVFIKQVVKHTRKTVVRKLQCPSEFVFLHQLAFKNFWPQANKSIINTMYKTLGHKTG